MFLDAFLYKFHSSNAKMPPTFKHLAILWIRIQIRLLIIFTFLQLWTTINRWNLSKFSNLLRYSTRWKIILIFTNCYLQIFVIFSIDERSVSTQTQNCRKFYSSVNWVLSLSRKNLDFTVGTCCTLTFDEQITSIWLKLEIFHFWNILVE